jgi:hypothetical protein
MIKINDFFECSVDAVYSLTKDNLCNVSKGVVRTKLPNASIFAIGEKTVAIAVHHDTHAYAAHEKAYTQAGAPGSSAYALVKGSTATATHKEAKACATCLGSVAITTPDAKSYIYTK